MFDWNRRLARIWTDCSFARTIRTSPMPSKSGPLRLMRDLKLFQASGSFRSEGLDPLPQAWALAHELVSAPSCSELLTSVDSWPNVASGHLILLEKAKVTRPRPKSFLRNIDTLHFLAYSEAALGIHTHYMASAFCALSLPWRRKERTISQIPLEYKPCESSEECDADAPRAPQGY